MGNAGVGVDGEEGCPGPVRDNRGDFLALVAMCSQTWRGLCQETTYDLVFPMLQILSMPRKYPPPSRSFLIILAGSQAFNS